MVAVPALRPVTLPSPSTVATVGLEADPDDEIIIAAAAGVEVGSGARVFLRNLQVHFRHFQLQPFELPGPGRGSRLGHQPGSEQHPAKGKRRQKPPSFLHPMSHRVVFPPVIRFAVWIRCRTHVIFQYKFSHLQLILHAGEARVKFFGANVTNSTWLLVSSPKAVPFLCKKRPPHLSGCGGRCENLQE